MHEMAIKIDGRKERSMWQIRSNQHGPSELDRISSSWMAWEHVKVQCEVAEA